jgi:hypothetical protein
MIRSMLTEASIIGLDTEVLSVPYSRKRIKVKARRAFARPWSIMQVLSGEA